MRLTYISFYKAFLAFLLTLFYCSAFAQAIKGTVKDISSGEPLIGVSVVIKGTTNGAITDFDGNFQFVTTATPPLTLVVSYIGYIAQEILVNDFAKNISIKLGANEIQLKSVEISDIRISEKQKESH